MSKSLINTSTTDTTGQVFVTYNGNNIEKLDIVVEDNFFDGQYNHLIGIPQTFTPSYHEHNIDSITNIEEKLNEHINNVLDILLIELGDNNGN